MTRTGLLLLLLFFNLAACLASTGLRQIVTRNVTGVLLEVPTPRPGSTSSSSSNSIMEIVEEQTCSAALIRLTCRSLHSVLFVLEGRYLADQDDACVYERDSRCAHKRLLGNVRHLQRRRYYLQSRYGLELDEDPHDFRSSINRRCSGLHHCRYKVTSDHPEALFWKPANIHVKYACIPESSIHKYCNSELRVPAGEGGFLQSPGYPLYYLGRITCGWKFRAHPGQRIVLSFRDFSIRDPDKETGCTDVLRVHDNGNTLYESCGTKAGVEVVSDTNVVTINFRASSMLYPKRGFFLQYKVLGCPDVRAPPGSRLSNVSLHTRTFRCQDGALFADSKQQARTIRCSQGRWIEAVDELPPCVSSTGLISSRDNEPSLTTSHRSSSRLAAEQSSIVSAASIGHASHNNNNDSSSLNLLEQLTRDRIGSQDNVAAAAAVDKTANFSIAEQTHRAMMKDSDTVLDVILPTILIAALFLGNAIIVYIIFRYRKRNSSKDTEELALQPATTTTTTSAVQANGGGDSCCPV